MSQPTLDIVFLCLQGYSVLFLLLHDWVPLGRLNNLGAMQREDSLSKRVFVTLLGVVPAALGFYWCALFFGRPYPGWLEIYMWAAYGVFLLGLLRAWWIPYLFVPDPVRAARYRVIFAGTYAFLPRRNGIVPDTLHVTFHAAVIATMIILYMR